QKYIKEMIQTKHHLKIAELSKLLGVSEMTVHRDVEPLVDEGVIVKTFGGIIANEQQIESDVHTNKCVCCSCTIHDRLSFHLILIVNKIEGACCAHCGLLRYKQ